MNAQAKTWEAVIIGDLPDVGGVTGEKLAGCTPIEGPAIDDLYICASFKDLGDTTLGSAGPSFIRDAANGGLPFAGTMEFNSRFSTDNQQFLDTVVRSLHFALFSSVKNFDTEHSTNQLFYPSLFYVASRDGSYCE